MAEENGVRDGPIIVASIGSGRYRQGQLLLENVIRAAGTLHFQIAHRFYVFAGPFIPDEVYKVLTRLSRQAPRQPPQRLQ